MRHEFVGARPGRGRVVQAAADGTGRAVLEPARKLDGRLLEAQLQPGEPQLLAAEVFPLCLGMGCLRLCAALLGGRVIGNDGFQQTRGLQRLSPAALLRRGLPKPSHLLVENDLLGADSCHASAAFNGQRGQRGELLGGLRNTPLKLTEPVLLGQGGPQDPQLRGGGACGGVQSGRCERRGRTGTGTVAGGPGGVFPGGVFPGIRDTREVLRSGFIGQKIPQGPVVAAAGGGVLARRILGGAQHRSQRPCVLVARHRRGQIRDVLRPRVVLTACLAVPPECQGACAGGCEVRVAVPVLGQLVRRASSGRTRFCFPGFHAGHELLHEGLGPRPRDGVIGGLRACLHSVPACLVEGAQDELPLPFLGRRQGGCRLQGLLAQQLFDVLEPVGREQALEQRTPGGGIRPEEGGEFALGEHDHPGELLLVHSEHVLQFVPGFVVARRFLNPRAVDELLEQDARLFGRGSRAALQGPLPLRGTEHGEPPRAHGKLKLDLRRKPLRGVVAAQALGALSHSGHGSVQCVADRVENARLPGTRRPVQQEQALGAQLVEIDVLPLGERPKGLNFEAGNPHGVLPLLIVRDPALRASVRMVFVAGEGAVIVLTRDSAPCRGSR